MGEAAFGGSAAAARQIAKVPRATIDKRTAFFIMPQPYRNAVSEPFR
ncbi:MAG TPA: hypothetical protein VJT70_00490 [Sphingomicrobium sp.]|nr:hypothetical protein [Sphingomicrobium sp.]